MVPCISLSVAALIFTIAFGPKFSEATNFTIVNRCKETIWPAITPTDNISTTGFALKPGRSAVFTVPTGWHGRIWGRTGCNFDNTGNGSCQTGSCGSSLECSRPGQAPATLAEIALGPQDFYDVSLVGGFNLPVTIAPLHGKGNCSTAGCDGDLRDSCPPELAVKEDSKTVACQSACDAFNTDRYCCRGMYGDPVSCQASNYSSTFKKVCPLAYSYAYDSGSIITCSSASDYIVTFCASSRNQTVCMYHDQKLDCNGSSIMGRRRAFSWIWWILVFALSSIFI